MWSPGLVEITVTISYRAAAVAATVRGSGAAAATEGGAVGAGAESEVVVRRASATVEVVDPHHCTMVDGRCFDLTRCLGRPFRVYLYDGGEDSASEDGGPPSSLFLLRRAFRRSGLVTSDPHEACLFVPPIDTLCLHNRCHGNRTPSQTLKALSKLKYWGGTGRNHLIVYYADHPMPLWAAGLAIVARSSALGSDSLDAFVTALKQRATTEGGGGGPGSIGGDTIGDGSLDGSLDGSPSPVQSMHDVYDAALRFRPGFDLLVPLSFYRCGHDDPFFHLTRFAAASRTAAVGEAGRSGGSGGSGRNKGSSGRSGGGGGRGATLPPTKRRYLATFKGARRDLYGAEGAHPAGLRGRLHRLHRFAQNADGGGEGEGKGAGTGTGGSGSGSADVVMALYCSFDDRSAVECGGTGEVTRRHSSGNARCDADDRNAAK